jgi:hypothetical protein
MLYPKGMIVDIHRHSLVDCSLNGISRYTDKVLLVGEGVTPIFEADDRLPVVELRWFQGHIYAAPYACANRSSAMGGNFIWSSDERFPARAPIALHDRFEQRCHLDERYFELATSFEVSLP